MTAKQIQDKQGATPGFARGSENPSGLCWVARRETTYLEGPNNKGALWKKPTRALELCSV